jgi:hypothetical protein
MPLDGSERAVDGRKRLTGIWLAPRGGAGLCVDLEGAVIWLSLDPVVDPTDVRYIQRLAEDLGYASIARVFMPDGRRYLELNLNS